MKTAKQTLIGAGCDQTYWGKKVIAAEKRGGFTLINVRKASRWTTCACGKQDRRIPTSSVGEPGDEKLTDYGVEFTTSVITHDFLTAAQTLINIEHRATEILRGIA